MASYLDEKDVRGARVLEIGSGTGYISVLAALRGNMVFAVDKDVRAVLNTRLNMKLNGVRFPVRLSDLFSNVTGTFDLILFNPPYLTPWEEVSDSTWDGGWRIVDRFLEEAPSYLSKNGCIVFVMEEDENWRKIRERLPKTASIKKNAFHLVRVELCQ